jgi:DegV family protein with EDD domain
MQHVHIVTDSSAHFTNPHFVHQYPVTVVPNKVTIAGKTYREGVDLSPEDAFRLLAGATQAPQVESPTEAEYLDVYTRLARTSEAIVSIHASREMMPSWQRARRAAQQVAGQCPIVVIDSRTLSAGQGMLVRVAVRAIEEQETLDDVVRVIRGAVERIYSVYYVESMTFLAQNNLMSISHTILGTMLGIKPLLTVEEGRLRPMEKARTRPQGIDEMAAFGAEFLPHEIEDAVIVQHKAFMSEQTRMLQDRLAVEHPNRHFPYGMYGPSLAALIGVDATGLIILEVEAEEVDDDFD